MKYKVKEDCIVLFKNEIINFKKGQIIDDDNVNADNIDELEIYESLINNNLVEEYSEKEE